MLSLLNFKLETLILSFYVCEGRTFHKSIGKTIRKPMPGACECHNAEPEAIISPFLSALAH